MNAHRTEIHLPPVADSHSLVTIASKLDVADGVPGPYGPTAADLIYGTRNMSTAPDADSRKHFGWISIFMDVVPITIFNPYSYKAQQRWPWISASASRTALSATRWTG